MRFLGRYLLLIAAPLATGGGAYVIARNAGENRPRAVAPDAVDVGRHARATTVRVEFSIRNDGRQPLDLWDVRTGCGCLAMAVRTPNGDQTLTATTVPPGGELPLVAEWAMAGERVPQFRRQVLIRTNDPDRPELAIPFSGSVHGWLVSYPKEVSLGELAPRQVIRRTVVLRDTGRPEPTKVSRVVSSRPDLVRIVGYSPAAEPSDASEASLGRRVGELQLEIVAPETVSHLAADVEVFEAGQERPVLVVPVCGRCVDIYSVHPGELALPRGQSGGESYTMTAIVRRSDDQPFALVKFDAPADLGVVVVGGASGEKASWFVQITWNRNSGAANADVGGRRVVLDVEHRGERTAVTIPVRCRIPE